ncbi:MAG: radical SAM protein [Nanoarchaeota archaeon]|nr:radical SAM protein [Nanoarchaeota archaeon]
MTIKVNPMMAPYMCYVNLTNKCNLRCLHCLGDYSEACNNELSYEEWKQVIDDLISLGVFYINVSGGEPTQHPYFDKIIDYLSYKGMHFILTTNGVMSKKAMDAILRNKEYLIGVKVSLDGYDAKSHCIIRKIEGSKYTPQLFKQTMTTIKEMKRNNLPLTIATVIHSGNISKLDKFANLIRNINPVSWFISPIIPSGRGNYADRIAKQYNYFDKSFWEEIVMKCQQYNINVNLVDLPYDMSDKNRIDYYECGAAISFCEINAEGTVSPCTLCRTCIPERKMKFDNLRARSLNSIWEGDAFNRFRSFMTNGCEGCRAFPKCTKCIAQSFRYFGNGISPAPYCIKNGENLGLQKLKNYQNKLSNIIK